MATLPPAKKRTSAAGSSDSEPKRSLSDAKMPEPPDVEVSRSATPANEMAVEAGPEMSRPAVVDQALANAPIDCGGKDKRGERRCAG